jgi:sodium/potassium-transporting ATPase subunit alpha
MLTMHPSDGNHSTELKENPEYIFYVKGAPDVLLPNCSSYYSMEMNKVLPLDEAACRLFSGLQERPSRKAEQVILLCKRIYTPKEALGSNYLGDEITANRVQDLTVIGVLGIMDPPRPESAQTVDSCRRAGIRFFMVTRDFSLIAIAIARQVGIVTGENEPHVHSDIVQARNKKIAQDLMKVDEKAPRSRFRQPTKSLGNLPLETFQGRLILNGTDLNKLSPEDWDVVCGYREIVFAPHYP